MYFGRRLAIVVVVFLGAEQQMHRRTGAVVMEDDDLLILVKDFRRFLARDDSAEHTSHADMKTRVRLPSTAYFGLRSESTLRTL